MGRDAREKEVMALLEMNPWMEVPSLAERLGIGVSMAYRLIAGLRKRGVIERDRHKGVWLSGK